MQRLVSVLLLGKLVVDLVLALDVQCGGPLSLRTIIEQDCLED
jgi:hypothetical protein